MTSPADEIEISGLDLPVRIGVPEEERAAWQVLSADIRFVLAMGFETMADDLGRTLDYSVAANEARELAAARPRLLLETLAADLVAHFLARPGIVSVAVTLRKRILPGTDHVAVRMRRAKEAS
jgi:dihydroneopterin aldolase